MKLSDMLTHDHLVALAAHIELVLVGALGDFEVQPSHPSRNNLRPVSPGAVLLHEFMHTPDGEELVSIDAAKHALGLSTLELVSLFKGKLPVSTELAEKLSVLTGTTAQLWINLDVEYQKRVKARAAH